MKPSGSTAIEINKTLTPKEQKALRIFIEECETNKAMLQIMKSEAMAFEVENAELQKQAENQWALIGMAFVLGLGGGVLIAKVR